MNLSFSALNATYAFGKFDRVTIEGISYQVHMRTEAGYVFTQDDASGLAKQFSHAELGRLGALGRIRSERDHYDPIAAQKRLMRPHVSLNALVGKEKHRLSKKEAYCEAVAELHREEKLKLTDASLLENMDRVMGRAIQFAGNLNPGGNKNVPISENFSKAPSPRSLRRWLKERNDYGLLGLVDNMSKRGNRNTRMSPEAIGLMMAEVRGYLSKDRPTIKMIHEKVHQAFHERNEERAKGGQDELDIPSREKVRRAIRTLDPFLVERARNGEAAARKKFRPVLDGIEVSRALERIEIDEWPVDVMTLMESSGIYAHLSDEEKRWLGLYVEGDKTEPNKKRGRKKDRWSLSAAICCATRCIVGMVVNRSPNADVAVNLLEMISTDKGTWADAVGSMTAWDMHGTPELIVFDGGSSYKAQRFRLAAGDLGVVWEMAMAGVPENRGTIERVFKTFSTDFAPRLSGHTFRSIIEKGDADPSARAALSVDDFTFALIRWVVDIYHNTPHRGLDGETPVKAWRRLSSEYGVTPPPDMAMMRTCFGHERKYRLDKTGITVLGVTYQSEILQTHFRRKDPLKVEVRWHPKDIGWISVCLSGKWFQVPALDTTLQGVPAQTWLTAVRHTSAANPMSNRLDTAAVREAIKAISLRNAAAMGAAGLNHEDWSEERMAEAERDLIAGIEFYERAVLTKENGELGHTIPSVEGLTGSPSEMGWRQRAALPNDSRNNLTIEED